MPTMTVRCPECREEQTLRDARVGALVQCQSCQATFTANPDEFLDTGTGGTRALLLGLSLLPFASPLLWLVAPFALNQDSIFSVAVPLSIAFCFTGLCVGVAYTRDWSFGSQWKIILLLAGVSFLASGLLFITKKDWVELIRRQVGHGEIEWREYRPADNSYRIRCPGMPVKSQESPITDWPLDTVKFVEKKRKGAKDTFTVSVGRIPPEFAKLNEDDFFAKMKTLLAPVEVGELTLETTVRTQGYPGREYRLDLADGGTNRAVRVFRKRAKVFVLVAEGPFLPGDHPDVQRFFSSLYIEPDK